MPRSPKRSGALAALLLVLVVLGAAGWWFRDQLAGLIGGADEPVAVSPEAAASAERKLQRLEPGGDPVQLSSVEITSLIRFRAPASALEPLRDPAVQMTGDTVRLSGMIPTDRLPSHPDLDRVRMLLPDTARLVVQGALEPLSAGRVALRVGGVEFAGIPIPERYYPAILERVGRRDEPGLDSASLGVPLPRGVASARVQGGYLLLTPASR